MRNHLWFWTSVPEGHKIIPDRQWWYGLARRDFITNRFLLAVIPLNLIIRFGYSLYMALRFPHFWNADRVSRQMEKEYKRGYEDGRHATMRFMNDTAMLEGYKKSQLRASQILLKHAAKWASEHRFLDAIHDMADEIMGPRNG